MLRINSDFSLEKFAKRAAPSLVSALRKKIFFTLGEEIPKLAAMDVPILLVWGAEDKSVPLETGRKLHSLLPTSRLEVFERAGHVPNYEEVDRFNRLAVEFLKQS